jgi:hypothetical protein
MDFARLARLEMGCDATQDFLVEECVTGPPLEVDGLSFGEQVRAFGVIGQVLSSPPYYYIEAYMMPIRDDALENLSHQVIRALGLTDCGFSIEYRGSTIIEVNGRLGEDDGLGELFGAAFDTYPIMRWIARDNSPVEPKRSAALAYVNGTREGVVRRVSATPEVSLLVRPGQALRQPGDPQFSAHLAYAVATHPTEPLQALQRARDLLRRVEIVLQ